MKLFLSLLTLLISFLLLQGCASNEVQQETSETEIPQSTDTLGVQLAHYDKNIQTLIQDPNGLIRGFSLGMDGDLIKSKNNTLQKVDSSDKSYTYSAQLDPVEAVDFTYQFEENKVNKIEVVIYPENEYRQGVYYRELKNYFSAKFKTKPLEDNNSLTWNIPSQDVKIKLAKTGSRKFPDLQLVFAHME